MVVLLVGDRFCSNAIWFFLYWFCYCKSPRILIQSAYLKISSKMSVLQCRWHQLALRHLFLKLYPICILRNYTERKGMIRDGICVISWLIYLIWVSDVKGSNVRRFKLKKGHIYHYLAYTSFITCRISFFCFFLPTWKHRKITVLWKGN